MTSEVFRLLKIEPAHRESQKQAEVHLPGLLKILVNGIRRL